MVTMMSFGPWWFFEVGFLVGFFFFSWLKFNFENKSMACLICFLCHLQSIKDVSGHVSKTPVCCPLHSRIWSCGFVTAPSLSLGPQWFCCGVQSSSIPHISKRKIIFQNYSKGKDLPFPQGLYHRFTVLLHLVYAFVAIPFLFSSQTAYFIFSGAWSWLANYFFHLFQAKYRLNQKIT